jgi:hypothetical protein
MKTLVQILAGIFLLSLPVFWGGCQKDILSVPQSVESLQSTNVQTPVADNIFSTQSALAAIPPCPSFVSTTGVVNALAQLNSKANCNAAVAPRKECQLRPISTSRFWTGTWSSPFSTTQLDDIFTRTLQQAAAIKPTGYRISHYEFTALGGATCHINCVVTYASCSVRL